MKAIDLWVKDHRYQPYCFRIHVQAILMFQRVLSASGLELKRKTSFLRFKNLLETLEKVVMNERNKEKSNFHK